MYKIYAMLIVRDKQMRCIMTNQTRAYLTQIDQTLKTTTRINSNNRVIVNYTPDDKTCLVELLSQERLNQLLDKIELYHSYE